MNFCAFVAVDQQDLFLVRQDGSIILILRMLWLWVHGKRYRAGTTLGTVDIGSLVASIEIIIGDV